MFDQNSYVGNYRILKKISSGAYGQVYLANHAVLSNRTVAIKLMHATHLSSKEEIVRFFNEAQFLEKLKHPHILPIIDVGAHEGFPYLVTEYASGGSLRDFINYYAPRRLSWEISLAILGQIADALQYAHQQGIIHRDLKPENILFNAEGMVLLADFGLATTLTTQSVKETGLIGTFAYMAPEQFQGLVCKESDQYALGCIAYELFTGHLPFEARDIATLIAKRLQQEAPPPKYHNPYLPVSINSSISKALSKDRTRRHKDMHAFISALNTPVKRLSEIERTRWMEVFVSMAGTPTVKKQKIIERCDQAIQLDSYFGDAYFCKGVALSDLGRYEEALVALTIATQLEPDIVLYWSHKGDVHKFLGQVNEAKEAYEIAKQLEALMDDEEEKAEDEYYDEEEEAEDEYYDEEEDIEEKDYANLVGCESEKADVAEGNDESGLVDYEDDRYEEYSSEAYDAGINFYEIDENEVFFTFPPVKPLYSVSDDYDKCYAQGLEFKQQGQIEKALEAFNRALQLNPKYVAAWHEKGNACLAKFQLEEAADAYRQAIQLNPYYIPSRLALANMFSFASAYEKALIDFDAVLSIDANNVQAWIGKGDALFNLGRYGEALVSCEQALKFDPSNVSVHLIKGRAFKEQGRYQEALVIYDAAIKIRGGEPSDYSSIYTNKGNILWLLESYKEAIECFENALQWKPDNAMALTGKGNALRGLGRYEEALKAHNQAICVFPDYVLAYCNKGNVLYDLERFEEAVQAYNKAIQIEPRRANAHHGRGNALWRQHRYEEALTAYDLALKFNPKNAYTYYGKGNVLFEIKRFNEALNAFDQAIQILPNETTFHFAKGYLLQQCHRYEEALLAYDVCIQIDPQSVAAHIQKGLVLYLQKRFQEALQILEQYTPLMPHNGVAWYIKGDLLALAGKFREAILSYDHAIQQDPDIYAAWRNKALTLVKLEEYAEAFKVLDYALSLLPDDPKLYEAQGRILIKYSKYAEAVQAFDRAIQLDPHFQWAHRGKIVSLQMLSSHSNALNAIEVALRVFPKDASFWFCKAVSLDNMGRSRESEKALKKAKQLGHP